MHQLNQLLHLIIFVCLLLPLIATSQNFETINYNEDTRTFSSSWPDNKPFNLRFKYNDSFDEVLLIEHMKDSSFLQTIQSDDKDDYLPLDKKIYWTTTEGTNKYLVVRFNDPINTSNDSAVFLKNNTVYSLFLIKKSALIKDIIEEVIQKQDEKIFLRKYTIEYNKIDDEENAVFWPLPTDLSAKFNTKIKTEPFDSLNKIYISESQSFTKSSSDIDILELDSFYYDIIHHFSHISDKLSQNLPISSDSIINHLLINLTRNKSYFQNILKESTDLNKNSNSNIENLKFLENILLLYEAQSMSVSPLLGATQGFLNIIETNKKLKSKTRLTLDKLVERALPDLSPIQATIFTGATTIYSYQERLSNRITPDLGLAYFGFQSGFNEVSLYLGFHLNFRKLDKDIAYIQRANKKFIDHFSINIGATVTSIEEEGRREGFVLNRGVLTGISYRFSHVLRVSAGSMLFRQLDENPLSANTSISATPYIGLSYDFEVRELLNGITNLFSL